MSKKFENIFDLNHVEDLEKALVEASKVQFNSIKHSGFEQKICRDNGRTTIKPPKPFIGLRQDQDPVLGFRIRSKPFADRLLIELHSLMGAKKLLSLMGAKKLLSAAESDTPHVTYHDAEPDWEAKYTDLVKAILEATKNVHDLSALIHDLERDHPELVEELNHED